MLTNLYSAEEVDTRINQVRELAEAKIDRITEELSGEIEDFKRDFKSMLCDTERRLVKSPIEQDKYSVIGGSLILLWLTILTATQFLMSFRN